MTIAADSKDATAALLDQLQQLIETQRELGILVYDYQATREVKEAVESRVNLLVDQLNTLNQAVADSDIKVPLDVVEYIENGRNANVYTREFVELLAKQNQYVNGKIKAMKEFGNILADELTAAYPELESKVKEIQNQG